MANEGSTKPTYSELEAENLRVRGLLQRMYELVRDGVLVRNVDEDDVFGSFVKQAFRLTATLRETEIALAESADIGKLDGADKSGVEMGKVNKFDAVTTDEEAKQMLDARFAEKVNRVEEKEPNVEKCAKCLWPLTNWRHDYKKEYHEFVHVTKPRDLSTSTDDLDFGSPLARKITERVARDAVKVLLMRHSSDIDIHEDAPTEAELEQDVVNVLLADDTGCLDPEDVSDENCTVLAVEKLLAGSAETGGEKAVEVLKDLMQELGYVLDMGGTLTLPVQIQMKKASEYLDRLVPNFPRSSQNQTVSSGVEGAHEGTTADKSGSREPEKLNNAHAPHGILAEIYELSLKPAIGAKKPGSLKERMEKIQAICLKAEQRGKMQKHDQRLEDLQAAEESGTQYLKSSGFPHKTVPVPVLADIDEEVASLVAHLNTIDGVRTHAACQGTIGQGGPNPYRAYVMVSWTPEALKLLRSEFEVAVEGNGTWGYVYPVALAESSLSSPPRKLPVGKGLWEVPHFGCDYPQGGCDCYEGEASPNFYRLSFPRKNSGNNILDSVVEWRSRDRSEV